MNSKNVGKDHSKNVGENDGKNDTDGVENTAGISDTADISDTAVGDVIEATLLRQAESAPDARPMLARLERRLPRAARARRRSSVLGTLTAMVAVVALLAFLVVNGVRESRTDTATGLGAPVVWTFGTVPEGYTECGRQSGSEPAYALHRYCAGRLPVRVGDHDPPGIPTVSLIAQKPVVSLDYTRRVIAGVPARDRATVGRYRAAFVNYFGRAGLTWMPDRDTVLQIVTENRPLSRAVVLRLAGTVRRDSGARVGQDMRFSDLRDGIVPSDFSSLEGNGPHDWVASSVAISAHPGFPVTVYLSSGRPDLPQGVPMEVRGRPGLYVAPRTQRVEVGENEYPLHRFVAVRLASGQWLTAEAGVVALDGRPGVRPFPITADGLASVLDGMVVPPPDTSWLGG